MQRRIADFRTTRSPESIGSFNFGDKQTELVRQRLVVESKRKHAIQVTREAAEIAAREVERIGVRDSRRVVLGIYTPGWFTDHGHDTTSEGGIVYNQGSKRRATSF